MLLQKDQGGQGQWHYNTTAAGNNSASLMTVTLQRCGSQPLWDTQTCHTTPPPTHRVALGIVAIIVAFKYLKQRKEDLRGGEGKVMMVGRE